MELRKKEHQTQRDRGRREEAEKRKMFVIG